MLILPNQGMVFGCANCGFNQALAVKDGITRDAFLFVGDEIQ